ncbi:sensor histidine kinase [Modestobacter sp. I12A-02628]|uniref:Sensor histidine kinase n=2 Tax=Goekera deserti TaxID=2497753 RepID=A0A7K3WBC2_9ACTN|nr:sensor histidine kinase [Goekera deserti]NDI47879.1 sensor histidine kinase [Goekera deserti]NEL53627.1 sensor histidine kinase [Goekera deserti]
MGTSRAGAFFAAIWLVYLTDPLSAAWREPSLPLRWLGVVSLAAFAVLFAGSFAVWRGQRSRGGMPAAAVVWAVLGLEVVLLALAAPAARDHVLVGLLYIAVSAAMMLPLRPAAGVLAALLVITVLLPRAVPGWASADDLVSELVLASVAAYGISQVLMRNAQLALAREQLVELAVTTERERLARDVHDILGHSLTVITVKAELTGRLLESVEPAPALDRARAEVADLEQLARGALADVRATAAGTRQVSLAGELAAARRALDAAGIEADLPTSVDVVPAELRELSAWVLREGVTNVVRHSGARRCVVRLSSEGVEVGDDGRGPTGGGCGTGLAGLQARAAAVGARLEVGASPSGGFRLRVTTAGRGRG